MGGGGLLQKRGGSNTGGKYVLQKEGVPRKRGGSNPGGKYACNQETFRQFEACI